MTEQQCSNLKDLYLISGIPFCIIDGDGKELFVLPDEFGGLYNQNFYPALIDSFRQNLYPDGVLEYYIDEYRFVAITALDDGRYFVTAPVCTADSAIDKLGYLKYVSADKLEYYIKFVKDIPVKLNFSLSRFAMLGKHLCGGRSVQGKISVKYWDSDEIVPLKHDDRLSSRDLSAVKPNTPYWSASHIEMLKECVRNGDFEEFAKTYHRPVKGILGPMANTSIQQTKYAFISLLHVIASAAVEGGMPHEFSLDLFSHYCLAMERMQNLSQIERLKLIAADDYCKKVASCRKIDSYHKSTIESIRYIHRHIYERISVQEISEHVHLNRSTLSAYFKSDTGTTIVAFINSAKLKEAKYLLDNQTIDYPQIIDLLGFCNQSYFIRKFREQFGMTPQQYRDRIT